MNFNFIQPAPPLQKASLWRGVPTLARRSSFVPIPVRLAHPRAPMYPLATPLCIHRKIHGYVRVDPLSLV